MAQGASKGAKGGKTKSIGATKRKAGHMRKGKMEIAPKSAQHIQEKRQKKELSSKINNSIEKQMVQAASSGKLTIMKAQGELDAGKGKGKAKA